MSKPSSCVVGGRVRARSRSQMLFTGEGVVSGERSLCTLLTRGSVDRDTCKEGGTMALNITIFMGRGSG